MGIPLHEQMRDTGRRSSNRKRVLMTATLFTPEGALSVRVRDLSAGGANVTSVQTLPASCDVIFKRGKLFAAGRIVWSKNYEGGVRFYRYLSSEEVAASQREVSR